MMTRGLTLTDNMHEMLVAVLLEAVDVDPPAPRAVHKLLNIVKAAKVFDEPSNAFEELRAQLPTAPATPYERCLLSAFADYLAADKNGDLCLTPAERQYLDHLASIVRHGDEAEPLLRDVIREAVERWIARRGT